MAIGSKILAIASHFLNAEDTESGVKEWTLRRGWKLWIANDSQILTGAAVCVVRELNGA